MKPLLKASDEAEFKRRYIASQGCREGTAELVWSNLQDAGIAEKPLEEGWYWARVKEGGEWEPVFYDCADTAIPWLVNGTWLGVGPVVIGPRILPPNEGTNNDK